MNGPYKSEDDIREETDKIINLHHILLEKMYNKFEQRDQYIDESRANVDNKYICRINVYGIIEFAGKMYKKNIMDEKIVHNISLKLLNYNNEKDTLSEEYIEGYCIFWRIIEDKIINPLNRKLVDQYYRYVNDNILTRQLSLRIRFMVEDLIAKYEKKYKCKLVKKTEKKNPEELQDEIEDMIGEFKKSHNVDDMVRQLQNINEYTDEIIARVKEVVNEKNNHEITDMLRLEFGINVAVNSVTNMMFMKNIRHSKKVIKEEKKKEKQGPVIESKKKKGQMTEDVRDYIEENYLEHEDED